MADHIAGRESPRWRRWQSGSPGARSSTSVKLAGDETNGREQRHSRFHAGPPVPDRPAQADRPRRERRRHRRRGLHAGVHRRHERRGGDPGHRPRRPVRDRGRALRPSRQQLPHRPTRPTRSATAPPTTPPAWPRRWHRPQHRQPGHAAATFDRASRSGTARRTASSARASTPRIRWYRSPSTVAYVNFDIQGANVPPSLRNTTFAIGSETGGSRFQRHRALGASTSSRSTPSMFSSIFGQGRSDYVELHRRRCAVRLLHRRDRPLLPHRAGRDPRRRLRQARPPDRDRRCTSPATWRTRARHPVRRQSAAGQLRRRPRRRTGRRALLERSRSSSPPRTGPHRQGSRRREASSPTAEPSSTPTT